MRSAFALAIAGLSALPVAMPKLESFKTVDGAIAFLVSATNGSSRPLLVISYVGQCTTKVDGAVVDRRNFGGSGGGRTIQPGQSWKELVRLVVVRDPDGRRHPNPDPGGIAAIHELEVQLAPGKHVASVACEGSDADSNGVEFAWPAKD